jgi:hypothetical protein
MVDPKGTASDAGGDSVAALESVLSDDTAVDTKSDDSSHTPEVVNVDKLLADLQANQDKIPADKLKFLDKTFHPAFNQRLNQLRDTVTKGVDGVLSTAGAKLPEGKSAWDLLTENNGKEFFDVLKQTVSNEVEPVRNEIAKAKREQVIGQVMQMAQSDDPLVKKHFSAAVEAIDKNPMLTELSLQQGGTALYHVLGGLAREFELKEVMVKNAQLTELLEKNKVATNTKKATSRAGGNVKTDNGKPPSLRDIAAGVLEKMASE